jgi:hypothetical protein
MQISKISIYRSGEMHLNIFNPKNHDKRARDQWNKKYYFAFFTLLDGLHLS